MKLQNAVLIALVAFCSLIPNASGTVGLWMFPAKYRLLFVNPSSFSASSFKECAAKVIVKSEIPLFFGFEASAQKCTYSQKISGFFYGKSTVTPAAWVPAVSQTVDSLQAEKFMKESIYGENDCPDGTTLSEKWCTTVMPNNRYGNYLASRFANNAVQVLTRAQVEDSLRFECENEMGVRMLFGNSWYCYTLFTNGIPANPSTISGNLCATLQAGSSVVKLTDKQRECGFLNSIRRGNDVYLGVFLPPGVKKSAVAFKYFDGTPPGPLPWTTGYPKVFEPKRNLVICDNVQVGKVRDVTALNLKALVCKKPAQLIPTTTTAATTVPPCSGCGCPNPAEIPQMC